MNAAEAQLEILELLEESTINTLEDGFRKLQTSSILSWIKIKRQSIDTKTDTYVVRLE